MPYALIVIEQPDLSNPDRSEEWRNMQEILSISIKSNAGSPTLDYPKTWRQGIVSLDLNADLAVFECLLSYVRGKGFAYQVAFLDREPEWFRPDISQAAVCKEMISEFR